MLCRACGFPIGSTFFSAEQKSMTTAASVTVEISVVCLLKRHSTADPDEMLLVPKDVAVGDVPLFASEVRDLAGPGRRGGTLTFRAPGSPRPRYRERVMILITCLSIESTHDVHRSQRSS